MSLIFVDCEAWGDCPALGQLTEFGAVERDSLTTFHGMLVPSRPKADNPAVPEQTKRLSSAEMSLVFQDFDKWLHQFKPPYTFVSDNPAFDWQWINDGFWRTLGRNPMGHSGRRISDFYAGLQGDFLNTQKWKRLRVTPHDHNPVNDAMGNVEAFNRLLRGER